MQTATPDPDRPLRVTITADPHGYIEQLRRAQEQSTKAAEQLSLGFVREDRPDA